MHIILVGDYTRRHSVAALSVLQVAACAALAWLATGLTAATLAAGTLFLAGEVPPRNRDLRGPGDRGSLLHPALGAAVHTTSSHAAILFTLEPVFASLHLIC